MAGHPEPGVLREMKGIVADGLLAALPVSGRAMLLIDDEYGDAAIRRVRQASPEVSIVVPVEAGGQSEFTFQYGDSFDEHIRKTGPDVVKALVRYNPEGDAERNGRSRARLHQLAHWLAAEGVPLMLELLVPPEPEQRSCTYDVAIRPGLTLRAIDELADLAPAYWKVEPQLNVGGFKDFAGKVDDGSALVLGRGENSMAVTDWIVTAAPVFGGFAVGRTIWAEPLAALVTGESDRQQAVSQIARNYQYFSELFTEHCGQRN